MIVFGTGFHAHHCRPADRQAACADATAQPELLPSDLGMAARTAYCSASTVTNFPNLFRLEGVAAARPATNSHVFQEECQVAYAMDRAAADALSLASPAHRGPRFDEPARLRPAVHGQYGLAGHPSWSTSAACTGQAGRSRTPTGVASVPLVPARRRGEYRRVTRRFDPAPVMHATADYCPTYAAATTLTPEMKA